MLVILGRVAVMDVDPLLLYKQYLRPQILNILPCYYMPTSK